MTPNWVETWIPAAEITKAAGVDGTAVRSWIRRNARFRRHGHQLYVHPRTADRYLAGRAATRPRGWKSRRQTAAAWECSTSLAGKIIRENPTIRTVRVGSAIFTHPEDVNRIRLERLDGRPLPGWISVPTLAAELELDVRVVHTAITSLGITTRRFTSVNADLGAPPVHVSPADANLLREWRRSYQPRKRTT